MKIAVLVSGGVDSSVALKLLKDEGYDITAFYIKIWLENELNFLGDCPWNDDLSYVNKVCDKIGVPLEVISLQKEYCKEIVNYTISEVKAGRTPNPDILCNSKVKFGVFFNSIDTDYQKIATGHYAQIDFKNGKFNLVTSPDLIKDQTYFLAHLSQNQLSKALFPIGHLSKKEVRLLAHTFDLPNKNRKDSQGICFLGKIKFKEFIKHHLGIKIGDLIEFETGKKLSTHDGFWFYTIGQRQGLGLTGGPWYVVSKDIENNIVYISRNYHENDKLRNRFNITSFNWLNGNRPESKNLQVKIRHGETKYNCMIDFLEDNKALVILEKNDQGIAPGQFAVFYEDNICLGSGIITY